MSIPRSYLNQWMYDYWWKSKNKKIYIKIKIILPVSVSLRLHQLNFKIPSSYCLIVHVLTECDLILLFRVQYRIFNL